MTKISKANTGRIHDKQVYVGGDYVHVNITLGESHSVVETFMVIFQRLLCYYMDNLEDVKRTFLEFLPDLELLPYLLQQYKALEKGETATAANRYEQPADVKKIKLLQQAAPEIFLKNFARVCQQPYQPTLINPARIAYYNSLDIKGKPGKGLQILPFPLDSWKYLCICEDPQYPYPGVKFNSLQSNQRFHVPCCFRRDQMSAGARSEYHKMLEDSTRTRVLGTKGDKIISTDKISSPGRLALLPTGVEELLRYYNPYVSEQEKRRKFWNKGSHENYSNVPLWYRKIYKLCNSCNMCSSQRSKLRIFLH